ncbi:FAD-binding protein [Salinactinospora qingdaonensis]|uniref:FAD-binding PCMH-type domain-containing protein n=1 Tax=Salinactinospora qingdaonensis TaxID=702744 RepID=A0ABP7EZP4_9ACTN
MSSEVSRRTVVRGMTVGTAGVVGWSALNQSWVTAASADTTDVAPVPQLDGTLETSPGSAGNFSSDFGKLTSWKPHAVLRPNSERDVEKMVTYTYWNDLKIAVNGQSGSTEADFESHSSYGQAAVPGGISIDARGLSKIHSIGSDHAVVGPGVTWAQLTDAALAEGLTPPSLPDYPHLSIGGVISVGGIGGNPQQHGLMCDTVEEIEVVTGTGRRVTASDNERRWLFRSVLAGGGQCGIIVRAKVKLVPAPSRILVFDLFYDDLSTYMADQEKVMSSGQFDFQEGELIRKDDDSGWRYKIQIGVHYSSDKPNQEKLLSGLSDNRAEAQISDYGYHDWVYRIMPFEAFLKNNGYWGEPKPWLSMVLPGSKTREFMNSVVLPELTPADLGVGFTALYPFKASKLTCPLFARPDEEVLYLFDLLRFPFPNDPGIEGMLQQNRRFYDEAVKLGAKRYLVGAVPDMDSDDWQKHFGRQWGMLRLAKWRYDPFNVLTPGQGFFD